MLDRRQARNTWSLGCPWAQKGCRYLHTPHISSFTTSCLYPALLLGSAQVKHSLCAKFRVGIHFRLLSARCHVDSTISVESRSPGRYFSVPSKGPSPWADSQTHWANAFGTSWACSQTTFGALWYVEWHVCFAGMAMATKSCFLKGDTQLLRCASCSDQLVLITALLLQTISSKLMCYTPALQVFRRCTSRRYKATGDTGSLGSM